MTKYGTRNGNVKAKAVTADSIVPTAIDLSNASAIGTAHTGTAAYVPVSIDDTTYYIKVSQ